MTVLITAEVPGQTTEGYDATIAAVAGPLSKATGFIAHGAGAGQDGVWRIFEVWDTQEQATAFFAEFVKPNLPPGVTPKRTYLELHNFVRG